MITCKTYRKTSNISGTKFPNLNVSLLALQLSLTIPLKPGVKSRMKMEMEQRRLAMFQLHLSDQQVYFLYTYCTGKIPSCLSAKLNPQNMHTVFLYFLLLRFHYVVPVDTFGYPY